MNCPIRNSNGHAKTIEEIKFEDFYQLEEIEEGYTVEYKGEFDSSVRKKIPAIFTSFANSAGGWLFVGIDDSRHIKTIQKTSSDFDQTLAAIIASHVTPIPKFTCRFVENPNDTKSGVLVVKVEEGLQPPYIAKGKVYIRVQSSNEQFGPADANVLIDLYRKNRGFKEDLNEFNRRTVYYPPTKIQNGESVYGYPLANIYLKNLYPPSRSFIEVSEINLIKKMVQEAFTKCLGGEAFVQDAYRSFMVKDMLGLCIDNAPLIISVDYDKSIKLHCPLKLMSGDERERALQRVKMAFPIKNEILASFINGNSAGVCVMAAASIVDKLVEDPVWGVPLENYSMCIEFENTQSRMLHFECEYYDEYIKNYGVPCFSQIDFKSKPFLFKEVLSSNPETTVGIECTHGFFNAIGVSVHSSDKNEHSPAMSLLDLRPEGHDSF